MFPQIDTPSGGPLTAADLTAARQHSTGRILAAGCDQQGRYITRPLPAEACTDLGADTRPAALSMERHNRTAGRVVLALLSIPALAAVAAVGTFIAQNLR